MTRRRFALLIPVFLAGLLLSVYAMSGRVQRFNAAKDRTLWAFQPVSTPLFRFAARDVSLTESKGPADAELVIVRYGDRELKLTASIKPGEPGLPLMRRHMDWLIVLRFAEHGKRSYQEFLDHLDEGNDRIAVVTRRPLTGADPRTGDVWQRDWMFDFHEFLPDGSIRTEGLRFPRTRGDRTPKSGELKAGTWQMDAALHLMPKTPPDSLAIGRPTAAFRGDAMKALGWTLPVSTLCAVGLVACLALAAAPRRQSKPAS